MMTVPDCTAPIGGEVHHGWMGNQILTAAETTAVIVVHAIKTHTSLCIPGATDVRPVLPMTQPASRVADVNGTDARPRRASGEPTTA
jgi:hypothetical protein